MMDDTPQQVCACPSPPSLAEIPSGSNLYSNAVGDVLRLDLRRSDGAELRVLGIVRSIHEEGVESHPAPVLEYVHSNSDFEIVDWALTHQSSALEPASALVMVFDLDARLSWVNEAFEHITGWAAEEVLDHAFERLQHQLGLEIEAAQITAILAGGHSWSGDTRLRTQTGDLRHLHVRLNVVRDPHGRVLGVLAVARDETELYRLRSVAEAVNLASNVGQMFAGIRHELGNPINSLKTALTVLRSQWEGFEPAHVDHYLERMLIEVGRVEYLLRSLRSFSAFEDPQLQRVSATNALREIKLAILRTASDRHIDVRLAPTLASDLPDLYVGADPRALYQVLLNLVANAMDAISDTRGSITLRASRHEVDRVALEVIDDGGGIPPDLCDQVRRPFFTTKTHGTGLGLTIVQRLVTAMRGEFVIESCPGHTVMRVLLMELPADA